MITTKSRNGEKWDEIPSSSFTFNPPLPTPYLALFLANSNSLSECAKIGGDEAVPMPMMNFFVPPPPPSWAPPPPHGIQICNSISIWPFHFLPHPSMPSALVIPSLLAFSRPNSPRAHIVWPYVKHMAMVQLMNQFLAFLCTFGQIRHFPEHLAHLGQFGYSDWVK